MGCKQQTQVSTRDPMFRHSSYVDSQVQGCVSIRKRAVKRGFGSNNHFLLVELIDGKLIAFEWMDDSKVHAYVTSTKYGTHCQNLGWHPLSEVYQAAKLAVAGRKYKHICLGSNRYNCNDWCEDAASGLGYTISCSSLCIN